MPPRSVMPGGSFPHSLRPCRPCLQPSAGDIVRNVTITIPSVVKDAEGGFYAYEIIITVLVRVRRSVQ